MTHYDEDDATAPKEITLSLDGFGTEGTHAELYLLDGTRDLSPTIGVTYCGERISLTLTLPLFTSYLIKLTKT